MKKILALLTILLLSGSAHAYEGNPHPVNAGDIEDETQDLRIPLSSNKLDTEISIEQEQRERDERPTGSVELGVSSWEPGNLQPPTRIASASSFSVVGPPTLDLDGMTPMGRDFDLVTGLQFVALQRTGNLDAAGITNSDTQTAYVPSLRLGVQYQPSRFATQVFRPYLAAAVLPTAVITSRSSFDDGEADFGVAGQAGAGTLIRVSGSLDVDVNVSEIVGKVNASSLTGFGAGAGVRFEL